MARHAGRNARVYMAITSAGTAEPIAFQSAWSLNATTDKIDVTAFGDAGHVYVGGLPDAAGTFGGWFDDATQQTYSAAVDGVARKAYFYPDIVASVGTYWFGTILPDFSMSAGVSDAISTTTSWAAASPIIRVG
jgi:hypothetical protein